MYPMHQKMDPWGGQHHCQCPLEQLIGMDQFKTALAKESPEVKGDIALVNKLIIKANTDPKFDWNKSTYPAFKARLDLNQLNSKVIIYFIAGYESHGHGSNWPAENEIDVYDWYDKLLETEGLSKPYKLLAIKAYLLYFQFDEPEPEKLFNLKKQVADIEPGFQNCISAANAGKKAKKWTEVVGYLKKGFKYYAKTNPTLHNNGARINPNNSDEVARNLGLPGGGGETFAIYEKIIEAQVESKRFGNALQTFNKIKKFNLDSMEADNVDYDTPKNKAIELSNFDGNDVLKSYYQYDKKTQAKIQSFKDAQTTVFILGSLCQWKGEIFKSFGGSPMDLKGHCDWLQLACEIYNFFWIDLSEFILKGPAALGIDESEDLIERTIYTACTIFLYEIKLQTVQMRETGTCKQHLLKRLKPTIDALTEHGKDQKDSWSHKFEIVKLLPKTVERFSIPSDDCRLCLDALIPMFDSKSQLTFGENKELKEQLVTYRNSLPIERPSELKKKVVTHRNKTFG